MKTIAKLALGALMLTGTAAATAAPADAGVRVGISVGVPGIAVGYGNPCYRPYAYRPGYCYPAYSQPLFIDGGWYREPVNFRYYGGQRYFWIHNGWQRDRDDWHHDRDGHGDWNGGRGDGHDNRGDQRR
jgi:hypothetical protein